jgi:HPt (histidine-containing phosphotransfer) domain-containing protein
VGEPCAIDLSSLHEQFGGDPDAVRKLLLSFLREGPETADAVTRALRARDAPEAARAAHRLKGVLAWISARAAAALTADVERLVRSGDVESASAGLAGLASELERVYAEARRATDGPGVT